jgi:hypothetical protein
MIRPTGRRQRCVASGLSRSHRPARSRYLCASNTPLIHAVVDLMTDADGPASAVATHPYFHPYNSRRHDGFDGPTHRIRPVSGRATTALTGQSELHDFRGDFRDSAARRGSQYLWPAHSVVLSRCGSFRRHVDRPYCIPTTQAARSYPSSHGGPRSVRAGPGCAVATVTRPCVPRFGRGCA